MPTAHEVLSEQFHRWEIRGRGWQVFDSPVLPEPCFVPLELSFPEAVDDGRRPTLLSSLIQKVSRKLSTGQEPPLTLPEAEETPSPFVREDLIEYQVLLPNDFEASPEVFSQFLSSLSLSSDPVCFEFVSVEGKITAQLVVNPSDAALVERQFASYFPDALLMVRQNFLQQAWENSNREEMIAVEFGLNHEFMLPLSRSKHDPFVGIVGALSHLRVGELGLYQVLWQPLQTAWAENILRAVTRADTKPLFVNLPELAAGAELKTSRSIYAVVVRIFFSAERLERLLQLCRDLAAALRVFANPNGNELVPLSNDDYRFEDHIDDVLRRQTRRTGMILSEDELSGFVHLPSSAVQSPAFVRTIRNTKDAPRIVSQTDGVLLGQNEHAGKSTPVVLSPEQRVRHMHVIGASGTGKTTLLFNLIRQDMIAGHGFAVLDPHGDLVDRILGVIPDNRLNDVVLLDPADEEFSIGFNILSAHSNLEKHLLASDLVSVFERLSASWGDQMGSVLQNAILAILESSRGGTLSDLRRFLIEPAFRAEFLKSVSDTEVLYYWTKAFPQLSGNKSIGSVLTRLETFLAPKPIRYMVSQNSNRIDLGEIMDGGKILLAKLSEGLLGKENSYLLGALLVAKFQQLAMSRQAQQASARRDFWLYMDEFQNFITPSLAEILTGARKYRMGLVLAHHELRQLERDKEVASAVLSNCYTRVVFRVGDDDARKLADGFSFFEARDLQNLAIGQAVCRVERSDADFNLSIPPPDEPAPDAIERRKAAIAASRTKYGTPVADVEAILRKEWDASHPSPESLERAIPKRKAPESVTARDSSMPTAPAADADPEKPAFAQKTPDKEPVEAPQIPGSLPEVSKPAGEDAIDPKELGRGGNERLAIQERLQKEAHRLGFSAEIEKQLQKGSNQAADLIVRQGQLAIAVEITVTTTTDHEFGNVRKCLAAGFDRVAVVSTSKKRLEAIASAVQGSLDPVIAKTVMFHTPEEFISELERIAAEIKARLAVDASPAERKSRGRTVRRHLPTLSLQEQKTRETKVIQTLADAMRRKK